jgi:hypothetical protein
MAKLHEGMKPPTVRLPHKFQENPSVGVIKERTVAHTKLCHKSLFPWREVDRWMSYKVFRSPAVSCSSTTRCESRPYFQVFWIFCYWQLVVVTLSYSAPFLSLYCWNVIVEATLAKARLDIEGIKGWSFVKAHTDPWFTSGVPDSLRLRLHNKNMQEAGRSHANPP